MSEVETQEQAEARRYFRAVTESARLAGMSDVDIFAALYPRASTAFDEFDRQCAAVAAACETTKEALDNLRRFGEEAGRRGRR